LRSIPRSFGAHNFPLAIAFFEQQKFAEARREFPAVRRQTGDHPNILYYLGRLDIETRDFRVPSKPECGHDPGRLFAFEHLLSIFGQMLG